MGLLEALQELREYVDMSAEIMTPGGNVVTLLDVWADNVEAVDNGQEDPNQYIVLTDGIHFLTNDGKDGGIAYAIE